MLTPLVELWPAASVDVPVLVPSTAPPAVAAPAIRTARVLHLINGEHYSGAERVQDLLARSCRSSAAKSASRASSRCASRPPAKRRPRRSSRCRCAAGSTCASSSNSSGLCDDEDYELIHAHTPRTALVGRLAAQRAGVPLVYHVHSPAGHDSTRRCCNAFNALVEWHSLRGADRLIAVSPSLRRAT